MDSLNPWRIAGLAVLLLTCGAADATGQLRPLDPVDWRDFGLRNGRMSVGTSVFAGHPAALTGTEGRLFQLGLVDGAARFGRVVVRVTGSAYLVFDERATIGEPVGSIQPAEDGRRSDSGDYLISTTIRLFENPSALDAALRFGVRLPTTDDQVGLERDQTDFFVMLAGRHQIGRVGLSAEAGLGIYGVVGPKFDQTDPLLFAAGIDLATSRVRPSILLVGQYDTRTHGPPPGNEHLAELRLNLRGGQDIWFDVTGFRGLAEYSPDYGLQVSVGRSF